MMERGRRAGFTFVEVIVSTMLTALLLGMAYQVFHLFFAGRSDHSLTSLTQRSFLQKDIKAGLRRLVYRLREAIQILEPLPGSGAGELVFRDVTNLRIRLRLDASQNLLISERQEGGNWVAETRPHLVDVGTRKIPASLPVRMANCSWVHFTVLSPECVSIRVGLLHEDRQGSFMTIVKLRNSNLAY